MKILLVIDQFFSANNGMTISARRFASKLQEHGHEIRIVSTGKDGDTEYLMETLRIPIFDPLITSQGMAFAKTDYVVLKEAIGWADVVHFLVPFALSHNALKVAREMNVPYTAAFHVQPENITSSIHMSRIQPVNAALYKWFNHYLYKYCDYIHCPSNFIANELKRRGYKGRLYVISNGIDPDFKYRKLEKRDELKDKFVIVSVGRLSIEKRQDITIRAVAKSKHRDEIKIMFAGQGPRHDQLVKFADEMGVDADFKFYNKNELLDLISQGDLYVHAAEAEIEAMSCMEAFAGGLVPIIADSPKSATPQFAIDERSLFKTGDPDELAAKIDYWIEHTEERKKMEYEYSELGKKYNLDECVRRAEKMFEQAIEDNRKKDSQNG